MMLRYKLIIKLLNGALLIVSSSSYAANEETTRLAKKVCAPCHGPSGISLVHNYPNLAGQKKKYMIQQLQAFKAGNRKSEKFMQPIAERLSDKEIKAVAKYYSKLDPDPADPTSSPD